MERFLYFGYSSERLEWSDVHLHARTQSVLYPLKVLKQGLVVALPKLVGGVKEVALEVSKRLTSLPPLWILMKSRNETNCEPLSGKVIDDLVTNCTQFSRSTAKFGPRPLLERHQASSMGDLRQGWNICGTSSEREGTEADEKDREMRQLRQ
jgi:hypothetical protein